MKKIAALIGASAILAGAVVTAPAAQAGPVDSDDINGRCESGEVCFYYSPGLAGSLGDMVGAKPDLKTEQFLSGGAGKGQTVANNAASVRNWTSSSIVLYTRAGFKGVSHLVAKGASENLGSDFRNNTRSYNYGR